MSIVRQLLWLVSAIMAFLCLGFFLQSVLKHGGQDAVLYLLGMAIGTTGVMTTALMED